MKFLTRKLITPADLNPRRSLQADRVVCSIDKMVYVRVNKYGLPKPHGGMGE